jgi:apolipoprotein D and lipocalin family protein
MRLPFRLAPLTFCVLVASPALAFAPPAPPTKPVELSKFAGRWFEIARVPNQFEKGDDCDAPTADYSEGAKGVSVVQTCHRGSPTGPEKVYRPSLQILDTASNNRFRLTYFVIFKKDYWVLDHAADYSWAVVGDPTGKFVWGFARTPGEAVKSEITSHIKALGYDVGRLEFPKQG